MREQVRRPNYFRNRHSGMTADPYRLVAQLTSAERSIAAFNPFATGSLAVFFY